MLKRDNIWIGLLAGLILPGIATLLVLFLQDAVAVLKRVDLLYIGCIALNLISVRYLFRHRLENTARGVVAATFVCAMIFFFYKVNVG